MNARVWIVGLVAAFLVAGVVSFYASGHPDGLEFVAEKTGFMDTAEDHAAADGPLADYGVAGIGNERLSGGLAGIIGVTVTLLVMTAIALVVRRKRPAESSQ